MYFDLNIPIEPPAALKYANKTKPKGKGKAKDSNATHDSSQDLFSTVQIEGLEKRIDVLVHLGYTILALNQTIQSSFNSSTHFNYLEELVKKLKKREGIIILKRLTIILDSESEKGTGLAKHNQPALMAYDIISLHPTSTETFSIACLKHSTPSPMTAHVISLPLTGPRIPFFFKHTLVRTAIKNGTVFEICYSPAVGSAGEVERRNWWAACRELTRVTGGKGVIISSGTETSPMVDVRAPKDIINIMTMLGFSQEVAKGALSEVPRKLVIRAHTRKTHQAVLSEPRLVYQGHTGSTEERSDNDRHLKRVRDEPVGNEGVRPSKRMKP